MCHFRICTFLVFAKIFCICANYKKSTVTLLRDIIMPGAKMKSYWCSIVMHFPLPPKPVSETRLGSRRLRHLWNSEGAIKIMTPRDTIFWDAPPPPTKKVHHHLMEIEDPQGERDSPEALISHAWETEERSSLRSAFRISLPWDAPALLAWRTVAPAPPRWRTGRTSGPLLVSWKFWNFHSLFLSVSLSRCISISVSAYSAYRLCIAAIKSLHRGHPIFAHGQQSRQHLSTASAALSKQHRSTYLWVISAPAQALSLYRYISLIILIYGKKE